MDSYTLRGLVFASFSMLALAYELFFVQASRVFLIIMYGIVITISVGLIFVVKDKNVDV